MSPSIDHLVDGALELVKRHYTRGIGIACKREASNPFEKEEERGSLQVVEGHLQEHRDVEATVQEPSKGRVGGEGKGRRMWRS